MGSPQHKSNRGRPPPGWLLGNHFIAFLCNSDLVTMADLAHFSHAGGGSLRGTMRRRVGPPEGYARFEGGRHKEAYWTSKTLRTVVRDLLLFEVEHGREHAFWSREKLAKLEGEVST